MSWYVNSNIPTDVLRFGHRFIFRSINPNKMVVAYLLGDGKQFNLYIVTACLFIFDSILPHIP